jgi:hypothetical protein
MTLYNVPHVSVQLRTIRLYRVSIGIEMNLNSTRQALFSNFGIHKVEISFCLINHATPNY